MFLLQSGDQAFIASLMLLLYGDWMVKVSGINGKKVITRDAFNVGKVSGAEMDDQWKMRARI